MLEDLLSPAIWWPVNSANIWNVFRRGKSPERKIHVNGSKLRTQGHRNNPIKHEVSHFFNLNYFLHEAFRPIFKAFSYIVL